MTPEDIRLMREAAGFPVNPPSVNGSSLKSRLKAAAAQQNQETPQSTSGNGPTEQQLKNRETAKNIISKFPGQELGKALGHSIYGLGQLAKGNMDEVEISSEQIGNNKGRIIGDTINAIATPASLAMPIAGSAVGRIAQGAGLGATFGGSSAAAKGESVKEVGKSALTGVAIGGALSGGVEAIKYAVRGVPKLLSYTSDTPGEVLQRNYDRPDVLARATNELKSGGAKKLLSDVQAPVKNLRTKLTDEFREGSTALAEKYSGQNFGFSQGSNESKLFGKVADRFGIDLPQSISNMSVKEGLALNAELNSLLSKKAIAAGADGVIVRKAKDVLMQKLSQYDGVKQLLSNYGAEKQVLDAADMIVKAYNSKNPISQTTALSRLRNAFSDNKPAYLSALTDLEKATGQPILDKVATLATQKVLPKAGSNLINQLAEIVALPLTSPRIAAAISRTAGRVGSNSTGLRNLIINLLSQEGPQ